MIPNVKHVARCILILSLALVMTAPALGQTTLDVWLGEGGDQTDAAFIALVEQFEADNPDIKLNVRLMGTAHYLDQFLTAVAGGTPPDVAYIDHRVTHELRTQGFIQPIDDLLRNNAPHALSRDTWAPHAGYEVIHKGVWYGVPFRTDIRGLYVNIDLLEQGGVDPYTAPKDIDDLDALARKLTIWDGAGNVQTLGFAPYENNLNDLYWMLAFGGQVFDWETYRLTLDDFPENREAIEWMINYADTYGMGITGGVGHFRNNRLAIHVNSTTQLDALPLSAPDINWWTHPVPHKPEGKNPTHSSVMGPVVPTGAKQLDAASRFLAYMASPETQLMWYRLTRMPPLNIEALMAAVQEIRDPREVNLLLQWPDTNPRLLLFERVQRDPDYGYRPWLRRLLNKEATPAEFFDNVGRLNQVFAEVFGE